MAFNLFDFSNLGGVSSIVKPTTIAPQIRGATGGGMLPPTTSGIQLQTTKPVEKPSIISSIIPKASASNAFDSSVLKQLQYDITKGATEDEVSKSYPELGGNSQLIKELHYDISKGATEDEIKGAYPELFGTSVEQTQEEPIVNKPKETQGLTTPISGLGAGFVNPLVEISKFSERYLEPSNWFKSKEEVDKNVAKVEKQLSGLLQEEGAKDMPGFGAGKLAGEIVSLGAMPTSQISSGIASLSARYSPSVVKNALEIGATKFPKIAEALKSYGKGVVPAVGFQSVSEGEVDAGETAKLAALSPILNVAKSLPFVSKLTGKSEISNAENISKGKALYSPTAPFSKIVGNKEEMELAARRIAGGDEKQVEKTIKAIGNLGTTKIRDVGELKQNLEKQVAGLSNARQSILSKESKLFTPKNSQITYEYSGTKLSSNPVNNAFKDLNKEVVGEEAAKLKFLETKFAKNGLSSNELDDLAKLHIKYNNAFLSNSKINKSKVDLEATRKGIKELIKTTTIGQRASSLDKVMSSAIPTRDNVTKIYEMVQSAKSNSIFKFGEQAGRLINNALDAKTGRAIGKTFGGSGEVKEGTLGVIGKSQNITKDLETIKKLLKAIDKAKTKAEALNLINSMKTSLSDKIKN